MSDLSAHTSTFPVVIDDVVVGVGGPQQTGRRSGRRSFTLVPEVMDGLVGTLRAAVQAKYGEPTCLLSLMPTAGDTNIEHVLLQGLGVHWVKLPTGLVRASINNRISKAEAQFLREGLMGTLRPFYVGGRKEVEFDALDGTTIQFINDPVEGFAIHIVEPDGAQPRDLRLPDHAGSGDLRFFVSVKLSDPKAASVALHKLAYLTLCLVDPVVALDAALQPVRDFIVGGAGYRPYAETFVPGITPGFQADFCISRSDTSGELHGGPSGHKTAPRLLQPRTRGSRLCVPPRRCGAGDSARGEEDHHHRIRLRLNTPPRVRERP